MRQPDTPDRATGEPAGRAVVSRDQQRALHAYSCVAGVGPSLRDYKIAVDGLGANILRNGLCAALATLQREKGERGKTVLAHLASAGIPGLEGATATTLAQRVRYLDVDAYMLATREAVRVAAWLKRAAQAEGAGRTGGGARA